VENFGGKVPN